MNFRRYEADKAHPGTCKWILNHESYTIWMKEKRNLLWIKGKPGSGKSTLMSFIHRTLAEIPTTEHDVRLEFFFHGRGTELQKTPVGMFRSLLHQLLKFVPSVRTSMHQAFEEKQLFGETGNSWEWQFEELQNLFLNAAVSAAGSRKVTIFVDALDEARPEARSDLVTFFHDLSNSVGLVDGTLKICISCRHYPLVGITPSLEICVEKHNHCDILSYINGKLRLIMESEPITTESIALHDLANEIATRASGVFQWVRYVIPMVVRYYSEGESLNIISERMKEVPDLDDIYKHILQNVIDVRNKVRSLHLMQWICLAERPLSVTELRHAIASDDMYINPSRISCHDSKNFIQCDSRMIKLITTLSGGLAEVNRQSSGNVVQFVHQSVSDFLLSSGLQYLFPPHGDESLEGSPSGNILGNSQIRLSRSCINYLRFKI